MKLIAHRGNSSKAPENTVISFKKSLLSGFNIIEFDVQLSKDNFPVIYHDERLERRTDGKGFLRDHNWNELKTGDDAYDATFFKLNKCPKLAFECHQKILDIYLSKLNTKCGVKS